VVVVVELILVELEDAVDLVVEEEMHDLLEVVIYLL
tara:strand:+ start:177 stop:284 length:108 start_codon:yes stop_codon:yes gene_type:complete